MGLPYIQQLESAISTCQKAEEDLKEAINFLQKTNKD